MNDYVIVTRFLYDSHIQTTVITTTTSEPSEIETKQISISSSIDAIKIQENVSQIRRIINAFGLFDTNGCINGIDIGKLTTLSALEIKYTDTEQKFGQFQDSDSNKIIRSYDFSVDANQKGILVIHINKEFFEDISENDLQSTATYSLVQYLYNLSPTKVVDQDQYYEVILQTIKNLELDEKPPVVFNQTTSLLQQLNNFVVPQVYAQSCGGKYACGQSTYNCRCSSGGSNCSNPGGSCGSGGTCNCALECLQTTYKSCSGSNAASCSSVFCGDCTSANGCGWSNPTPTPVCIPNCANKCNQWSCTTWCTAGCGGESTPAPTPTVPVSTPTPTINPPPTTCGNFESQSYSGSGGKCGAAGVPESGSSNTGYCNWDRTNNSDGTITFCTYKDPNNNKIRDPGENDYCVPKSQGGSHGNTWSFWEGKNGSTTDYGLQVNIWDGMDSSSHTNTGYTRLATFGHVYLFPDGYGTAPNNYCFTIDPLTSNFPRGVAQTLYITPNCTYASLGRTTGCMNTLSVTRPSQIIRGRVVGLNMTRQDGAIGSNMKDIPIKITNITLGTNQTTTTDEYGYYSLDSFVYKGDTYKVELGSLSGYTSVKTMHFSNYNAPTGVGIGWTWNHSLGRDTRVGEAFYDNQRAGFNDCSGADDHGETGRCSFGLVLSPPVMTSNGVYCVPERGLKKENSLTLGWTTPTAVTFYVAQMNRTNEFQIVDRKVIETVNNSYYPDGFYDFAGAVIGDPITQIFPHTNYQIRLRKGTTINDWGWLYGQDNINLPICGRIDFYVYLDGNPYYGFNTAGTFTLSPDNSSSLAPYNANDIGGSAYFDTTTDTGNVYPWNVEVPYFTHTETADKLGAGINGLPSGVSLDSISANPATGTTINTGSGAFATIGYAWSYWFEQQRSVILNLKSPDMECNVSLSPANVTTRINDINTLTATVSSVQYGTVDSVEFISDNSSVAAVTSPDKVSPYQSTITAKATGGATINANVFMRNNLSGKVEKVCSTTSATDTNVTVPTPTCSVNTTASQTTINIGQTSTITSVFSPSNGNLTSASITRSPSANASLSASTVSGLTYTNTFSATAPGTYTVTAFGTMQGGSTCTDNVAITVRTPSCTVSSSLSVSPNRLNTTNPGYIPNTLEAYPTSMVHTAAINSFSGGTPTSVNFDLTANPGGASVSPVSDDSSPYQTTIRAGQPGTITSRGRVQFNNAANVCQTTTSICVASCGTAGTPQCGQPDTCGGFCPNTDGAAPATAPTITYPIASQVNFSPGQTSITIRWTSSTPLVDGYRFRIYKQGGVPPDWSNVTAETSHVYTPTVDNGRELTFEVQSVNSTCTTLTYSPTATRNFSLTGTIAGEIAINPNASLNGVSSSCTSNDADESSLSSLNDPTGGLTLRVADASNNTVFNNPLSTYLSDQTLTIPSVPYAKSGWPAPYPYDIELHIDNTARPANEWLTCRCPGSIDYTTNVQTCQFTDVGAPTTPSNVNDVPNIYLQTFDFSTTDSWWQVAGGLGYSILDLVSPITSYCLDSDPTNVCIPAVAVNAPYASAGTNSIGLAMSNTSIDVGPSFNSNTDSGFRQISGFDSTLAGQQWRIQSGSNHVEVQKENYEYFAGKMDLSDSSIVNLTSGGSTLYGRLPGGTLTTTDGLQVYKANSNLTIDIDSESPGEIWNISSGEKIVIFVNGDLRITDTGSDPSVSQELINVDTGSFLGFIVSGTIYIDSTVGHLHEDPTSAPYGINPQGTENAANNGTTANIEGVFIADQIIIESVNDGTNGPSDLKFIGSGTFAALNGEVQLNRQFYYTNEFYTAGLNHRSPAEQFIYRPDFLVNFPTDLKDSGKTWQEIP